MRRVTSFGHRRAYAALAALLWLLGVEVLPNAHLAFHDDDHTHEADGTIVATHHDDHDDHDDVDGDHHHAALAHDRAEPDEPHQLAIDTETPGHAAAGLAHHALALHQPPPPDIAPLHVPCASARCEAAPDDQIHSIVAACSAARGPPAA